MHIMLFHSKFSDETQMLCISPTYAGIRPVVMVYNVSKWIILSVLIN